MAIELKLCPFCGGEAQITRKKIKTNGCWCDAVYVHCPECDARTNRVLYSAQIHGDSGAEYAEAAEAWNRRTERTCHLEEGYGDAGGNVGKVCSECKTTVEFHWREPPNYCANCGAKVVL